MAVLTFYVDEYTTSSDQFATYDAIANVSSKLTNEGFSYPNDFWLAEVFYKEDGRQVVVFEFKNDRKAMLVKLKGIKNE
tara:strand:- start:320 stop:556 length:237 start_codon:yes stop_codon:yes gene_type:complete